MSITQSETSAYRLWKRMLRLHDDHAFVPRKTVAAVIRKYLSGGAEFTSGRIGLSWKVMVKINLADLLAAQMSRCMNNECMDEYQFNRMWLILHLENMSVFFEKVIELIDESAPCNDYLLSSKSMYAALCKIARCSVKTVTTIQLDFLHYVCYFYCGSSPGFLHKHEITLLLQDLCRDWRVIHERLFNFCDLQHRGSVPLGVLKTRCPTLVGDGSRLMLGKLAAPSSVVFKTDFLEYMKQVELTAFICNEARLVPIV